MSNARIIKRYANRKLYDMENSRYVTLDHISSMIRAGEEVTIVDNKTKEDLTSVTLAQIIFEQEKKQRSFLSLQALRGIIQYGENVASLVSEAQKRVTNMLPRRPTEDAASSDPTPSNPTPSNPTPIGPITNQEVAAKKTSQRAWLDDFRAWIDESHQVLDKWQRKVDGTIRTVVGGISPFASLHKDVHALSNRIAELEQRLSRFAIREGNEPPTDD